jgi:hypothetical protein
MRRLEATEQCNKLLPCLTAQRPEPASAQFHVAHRIFALSLNNYNSFNMTLIEAVIADIDSLEAGNSINYSYFARKHGVNWSTLSRCY